MDLISPSLLENVPKRSKECHERFRLGSGLSQAKKVPMDLLEKADTAGLGKWLSLYVAETRKQDGGRYPPKSVCMLLTGFFVIICALLARALSQLLGTIYNGPALPYSAPPELRQYEHTTWVNSRQCPEFYHQQRAQRDSSTASSCTTDEIF